MRQTRLVGAAIFKMSSAKLIPSSSSSKQLNASFSITSKTFPLSTKLSMQNKEIGLISFLFSLFLWTASSLPSSLFLKSNPFLLQTCARDGYWEEYEEMKTLGRFSR